MPLGRLHARKTLTLGLAVLAALLAFGLAGTPSAVEAQGQPPPGPVTYSGTVTVGGAPAPDGLSIVARLPNPVGDDYQSLPRVTQNGRYMNLIVGPTNVVFNFRAITFHIIAVEGTVTAHLGPEGLTAAETQTFIPGPNIVDNFTLTFPALPPTPTPVPETPTPVPTATPVATATPVPTPTPMPTATPVPTATPQPTATPTPVPTATPSPTPVPPPAVVIVTATPTAAPPATATPTPEPEEPGTCQQGSRPDAYALIAGLGLLGLVWMRRRRSGA